MTGKRLYLMGSAIFGFCSIDCKRFIAHCISIARIN